MGELNILCNKSVREVQMTIYNSDIPECAPYPIFQGVNIWIGNPWEPSGSIYCLGSLANAMASITWSGFIVRQHVRSEWTRRFA